MLNKWRVLEQLISFRIQPFYSVIAMPYITYKTIVHYLS